MTLEKLLGYSSTQLESMPAAEWQKILEPYLNVTRPDRAPKPDKKGKPQSSLHKQKVNAANDLFGSLGIDLDL